MKRLSIFALLFATILPLNLSAEEITLGALLHLSGDYAMEGAAFREGIELGLEDANAELKSQNLSLKIDIQDTRYVNTNTVTLAHRANDNKSIKGLIVSTFMEVKPIAPILEKGHLPAIVLWDATPEIENFGDYIFSIGPWAPDTGEKSARFAVNSLKAKKIYIVYQQHEWSNTVKSSFSNRAKKSGAEINDIELQPTEADFKTILTKVRAFKPDAIYAPIVFGVTPFAKQYKIYLPNIPLIMSDNISQHLIDEDPKAYEGVYNSAVADPKNKQSEMLTLAFRNRYKSEPKLLMFLSWGYDSVLMYKEAIMRGARTREEIKDALYQIKNLQGATGEITVNSKGSSPKYISMFKVKNSKLELVEGPDPE